MEQIKGGMLEMLKYVAASQMNPAKAVNPSASRESEFGKLLEQKNTENRQESTSGKSDTDAKEITDKESVKTEKRMDGSISCKFFACINSARTIPTTSLIAS